MTERTGLLRAPSTATWWRAQTPGARRTMLAGGSATMVLAVVACLFTGLSPVLPVLLALLLFVSVRPFPGVIYVAIVLSAPLGLWMIGVKDLVGDAFGGRDYALSLSASVIAWCLLAVTLIRRPPSRRQMLIWGAGVVLSGVWVLIGIAHHGVVQTLVGVRLTGLPVILLVVLAGLTRRELYRLVTVTAWLLIANAVAGVVEYVIGPERLLELGLPDGTAVRYIGTTFRAPGLTEVNAALGLLAGSFLLGYAALWLVQDNRPRNVVWHLGAGAALISLALSTSRTGALLLAGGLIAAVVLNRGGSPAARRRGRWIGIVVVVCVVLGLVAVGATGSSSLFERFGVWGRLLRSAASWYGVGVGGVGAATNSRASNSPQIFVDNYFVSVALQFGIPVLVALMITVGWVLVRLSRRSQRQPGNVVHLAVLAGLSAACLMIEVWEYAGAMMCLALFVGYAFRSESPAGDPEPPGSATAVPGSATAAPASATTAPASEAPALDETVRLSVESVADTVVRRQDDLGGPAGQHRSRTVPEAPALDETVRLSVESVADTVVLHRDDLGGPAVQHRTERLR
jgi:hypothetical protein